MNRRRRCSLYQAFRPFSAAQAFIMLLGSLAVFQKSTVAWASPESDGPGSLRSRLQIPRGSDLVAPPMALATPAPRRVPLAPMMAISEYSTPSESELLAEAGISQNADYEAGVRAATRWLSHGMGGAERVDISRRCDLLVGETFRSFPVTSKTVECVPWAMERVAASRLVRREKIKKPDHLLVVKTEEGWQNLRGVNFQDSFLRVDPFKFDDVLKLQEFAKKTASDCSFKGANASLIARVESFLPDERAIAVIEDLYPASFRCLEPDDEGFERTHMRVGLLRLLRGEIKSAKPALLLAAHAEDNSEEFRALFWLGVVEEAEKEKPNGRPAVAASSTNTNSSAALSTTNSTANSNEVVLPEPIGRNASWDLLRKKYPLTIHAVMASHVGGFDPLDSLVPGSTVQLARRVGKGWTEFNTSAFLFELLAARQEQTALTSWSQFVARNIDAPNPESSLFLAWSHHEAQNYRSAISVLSRYFRDTQNRGVSLETLNLAFPRPFSEEIIGSANKVDPVLVFALIRQESAFDPQARSAANARGLMQLLPSTARKWLARPNNELFNPASNVRVGVQYMQELMRKYDGNAEHMLAAYNAGWKNLERWKQRFPQANSLLFSDLIPFKETRTYVAVIMRNSYWYGRLMAVKNDKLAKTMVEKSMASKWRSNPVHQLLELAWSKAGRATSLANLSGFYTPQDSKAIAKAQPTKSDADTPAVGLSAKGLELKSTPGAATALQKTPQDPEINLHGTGLPGAANEKESAPSVE